MFRKSKPLFLDHYGGRRSRWRPPGWLLLLVFGIVAGAVAVLYAQERYLPERLTPAASAELRHAFDEAAAARDQLRTELDAATQRLHASEEAKQAATEQLGQTRAALDALKRDLSSVVASLPPDPRGGAVEVRAGWLSFKDGNLTYDLVLTRNGGSGAGSAPLAANLQITAAGQGESGTRNVAAKPVAVTIDTMQVLHGSVALPKDFRPDQATVQLLDRGAGRQLGMRVLLVK